ncbi:MAG TPA: DUF1573 domain-containing protein [Anaerohalosphaeraceae bacterium]|nr:DUF1573 domain-containing protein [Anaerohalosphaeraceae bacterium]HOL30498.1 DUF1573 domain-containing protein [Anaerohalosphaeraceae bacterium]HOM75765.1 DUF1573 domain-containing protein [Anaerohalosphaeraceae bacterium]HPC63944.1 DUF1573 domain-containing protein [Anaerohalosphaeraceae bacterium]HPO69315.1 DUF1573 domain-containing protein [Anaerohalosphaeraceae bacterium]
MKYHNTTKLFCILCAVLAVGSLAGCQRSETKTAELKTEPAPKTTKPAPQTQVGQTARPSVSPAIQTPNAPSIKVENPSVNFGQVGPNSVHKAVYAFSNSGNAPLSVTNVQSTCGCSLPTLIKNDQRFAIPLSEPVLYEPGQSGKVEVTFTAPSTKGLTTKHLYIISNDPVTPRAELLINAEVTVKIAVSPENADLRFDKPNAGMPSLIVKSLDEQSFSIRSISIPNDVMKIDFDPGVKKKEFVLEPVVALDKLQQYTTGVIQITTDHPQSGTLVVHYAAQPKYEVSRPRIILQNVEPQVPVIKDVIIRSNYGEKVEIASVQSRQGYMTIESQEPDGNNIKLMVKITPPAQGAQRYITDEMILTLKNGEELSIRCSGWFRVN